MPLYKYKIENNQGEISSSVLTATSQEDAAELLKKKGKILWLKKRGKNKNILKNFFSVPLSEKATFCRHLATMLKAGISLNHALEIMAPETQSKRLAQALEEIQYGIQKGASISSELARFPDIFDDTFVAIVKAGTESGNLKQSFNYLGKELMSQYQLTQKVKGALTYPAVILVAMFGVGMAMLTFVLPKIGKVFISMKINIPITTRILLGVSNWLGGHVLMVILGFFGIIIGGVISLKINAVKNLISKIVSKLPVLNKLFQELDLARFSRTLSLLLKAGVPIIEAINTSSQTLSLKKYKDFIKQVEEKIKQGKSMSDIFADKKSVFPAIMSQTIKAGENSGELETVLMDLAEFYEQEVESTLKRFVSVLEPVFMLAIGIAVAGMVISILAPIYSVVGNLQQQQGL